MNIDPPSRPGQGDRSREEHEWAQTARSVQRRQRFLGMPNAASRWVNQIIARRGIAQAQSAGELEITWREVAGEILADRTRVAGVRRGICEITVENSALLQKIIFQQRELLQKLQSQKPHFGIQGLRFRIGEIR